jgi:hypothetical protein
MPPARRPDSSAARRRIEGIRRRLDGFEMVCSGTLIERTKTCGKPNCRCATDPEARHGPYHEWNRRQEGRLVHTTLTPEQARRMKEAIKNYREIQALLKRWECESTAIILSSGKRK